jgi:Arc/MetJ-type ribon-helix-helix transcriptional regulator
MSDQSPLLLDYPPEIRDIVENQLASRRYESEPELLKAAVAILREMESRHQQLRAQVQRSLDEAARGEIEAFDVEELKAELAEEWTAAQRGA